MASGTASGTSAARIPVVDAKADTIAAIMQMTRAAIERRADVHRRAAQHVDRAKFLQDADKGDDAADHEDRRPVDAADARPPLMPGTTSASDGAEREGEDADVRLDAR